MLGSKGRVGGIEITGGGLLTLSDFAPTTRSCFKCVKPVCNSVSSRSLILLLCLSHLFVKLLLLLLILLPPVISRLVVIVLLLVVVAVGCLLIFRLLLLLLLGVIVRVRLWVVLLVFVPLSLWLILGLHCLLFTVLALGGIIRLLLLLVMVGAIVVLRRGGVGRPWLLEERRPVVHGSRVRGVVHGDLRLRGEVARRRGVRVLKRGRRPSR